MSELQIKTLPFTRAFVGFIERRPRLALALGLMLVLAFVPGLSKLRADFTHRAFFWADDPHLQAFDAFERRFGNDDAVVLAVHSPSGVFDVETAGLVQRLTDELWRVPEVIRVDSLSNYNWVHSSDDDIVIEPLLPAELTPELLAERERVALAHEVLPDYLVSRDARTTLLFAHIQPAIDRTSDYARIMTRVRELMAEYRVGDHELHASGGPAVNFAFEESSQQDLSRLVPMLLAAASLFLLLTLRSLAGVILPFFVVALAIVVAFGLAGYLGVELSIVTTASPNILIAVCIANVVHVMATFYRKLSHGEPRAAAARYSLTKNFMPTFLTSLTTTIGFFGFASAHLKPLSGLGTMAGVGTLTSWLLTYLVGGSLLFLLPLKRARVSEERIAQDDRVVGRLMDFVARNRTSVLAATAFVTLGSLWLALKLDVNSDPLKYFRADFPARVANEFIEEKLGGARGVEIVIDSGREDGVKDPEFLRRVESYQGWIEREPGVTRAVSILDILKSTHRSLNGDRQEFYRLPEEHDTISQELLVYSMGLPQGMDLNDRISVKNDALRMTVLWTIPTSRETMAAVQRIEEKGKQLGLEVRVTGKNRLYASTNEYVVDSFVGSFVSSLVLISLILVVAFRSVKMGLFAMVPNIIPNFIGGGLLYLMGQPLDIGTVLVASVALGIAVDDTIHILANFMRHRRGGHGRNQAIRETLVDTAPALISTTLILSAGFGLFAFGSFVPNIYFGILMASVLTLGLIIDLTFLPAILMERAPAPLPEAVEAAE